MKHVLMIQVGAFGFSVLLGCRLYHLFYQPQWTEAEVLHNLWPWFLCGFVCMTSTAVYLHRLSK